jgi:hypothetical protein
MLEGINKDTEIYYIESMLTKRPPNKNIGITIMGARAREIDTLLDSDDTTYPIN